MVAHGFQPELLLKPLAFAAGLGAVLSVRLRAAPTHEHVFWAARCRACRYELGGLAEGCRCPECGLADAGRTRLAGGRLLRPTPDLERGLTYLACALAIVLLGVLRPLIWDWRHALTPGAWQHPLAYSMDRAVAWSCSVLFWWAVLWWALGLVRNRMRARAAVAAVTCAIAVATEIMTTRPSMLRLELITAGQGSRVVQWMAATGLAALFFAVLLDALRVRTIWPNGVPRTLGRAAADEPRPPTLPPCTSSSPTTTASAPPGSSPSTAPSPLTPRSATSPPSPPPPSRAPPRTASPSTPPS